MVIYGEYLFLENFVTGLVILYFTGKAAGAALRAGRLLLGGVCCGLYSFILFINVYGVLALAGKLAFAAAVVCLVFGRMPRRRFLACTGLFLLVTFLYGGTATALLYVFGWQGAAWSGGVYFPVFTYLTVTASASAAALLLQLFLHLIQERRKAERTSIETVVIIGEKQWKLQGFIDSGNMLREPVSRKPVAVVSRTLMEELLQGLEDAGSRYTVVPYRSVGVAKGVMDGYRADAVRIRGKTIRRPVLAVCEDDSFLTAEDGGKQILLPAAMLERGIYANID